MSSLADYSWVASLAQRYELASTHGSESESALLEQLPSLQFASTVLQKKRLDEQSQQHATHIVVLGPTQSGKSTLVNVLLGARAASVSALAGFTVHSQGYASQIEEADSQYVDQLMTPLQRISGDSLDSANLESYVLEAVASAASPLVENAVVWDTPDFDSITAAKYSLAVVRTAALADVIVLTVSKDKYGDKRVWDILDLIHTMGKAIVVCINKVSDKDRQIIHTAFTTRFESVFGTPLPGIVMLPFIERDETQEFLPLDNTTRALLHDAIDDERTKNPATAAPEHCSRFIARHQDAWLAPLIAEMDAKQQWFKLTENAIDEADQYYQSHYLDSPDKYETFNRALAELLTLLEIPGVAATFARARQAVTWPARRLLGVGRKLISSQTTPARNADGHIMDHEELVLQHILDSTLIRVQRELLEAPANAWWQALDSVLRTQLPTIRAQFDQASEQARREFEPEIDKAAAGLYKQLGTQPALLNTLRATRASADAAGIALAVKTGGLAPADLILAPAMLAVTTLLTESALGRYLDSIKRELKQRQRQHIRDNVLNDALQQSLVKLMEQVDKPELMTNALEPALQKHLDACREAASEA